LHTGQTVLQAFHAAAALPAIPAWEQQKVTRLLQVIVEHAGQEITQRSAPAITAALVLLHVDLMA
jgi:hypothetical protein